MSNLIGNSTNRLLKPSIIDGPRLDPTRLESHQQQPSKVATSELTRSFVGNQAAVANELVSDQQLRAKIETAAYVNKKVGNNLVSMRKTLVSNEFSLENKLAIVANLQNDNLQSISKTKFQGKTLLAQTLDLKLDEDQRFDFNLDIKINASDLAQPELVTAHFNSEEPLVFSLSAGSNGVDVTSNVEHANIAVKMMPGSKLGFSMDEATYQKVQGVVGLKGAGRVLSGGQTQYLQLNQQRAAIFELPLAALSEEQIKQLPDAVSQGLGKIRENVNRLNQAYQSTPISRGNDLDQEAALKLSQQVLSKEGFGFTYKALNTQANIARHITDILR